MPGRSKTYIKRDIFYVKLTFWSITGKPAHRKGLKAI